MTAYLRVQNGIYQMVFSFPDANGHWKKRSESTGLKERGNKRAAEAKLKARLDELSTQQPEQIEAKDILFLDAMEEWLNVVMPTQVRPNTLDEYRRAFACHTKAYEKFKSLPLQKLTPQILQSFYNDGIKAGLSPNTIHKQHSNISKFLKYALRLNLISSNPAERVTLPKKVKSRAAKFYTQEQLQALLALFWDDCIETAVYLTAHLGLRRSEVCGLRWDSVDFDRRQIFIQHTAVVVNGTIMYADTTKSESSRRVLSMSNTVYDYLQHTREEREKQRKLLGNAYNDSGYVCAKADGTPINPDFVTHHFQRIVKASDLPDIRFHDLRHSCASLLHECGCDLKDIQTWLGHSDIQTWLGHSDIQTTGNIYTHLDTRRMDKMAQAVGDALTPKLRIV